MAGRVCGWLVCDCGACWCNMPQQWQALYAQWPKPERGRRYWSRCWSCQKFVAEGSNKRCYEVKGIRPPFPGDGEHPAA
jgi:hypothetical protein